MGLFFGFKHVDVGVGYRICGVRFSLIPFFFFTLLALFRIIADIDIDNEGIQMVVPRLGITTIMISTWGQGRDVRLCGSGRI